MAFKTQEARKAYYREWYKKNQMRLKNLKETQKQCLNCSSPSELGKKFCARHLKIKRKIMVKNNKSKTLEQKQQENARARLTYSKHNHGTGYSRYARVARAAKKRNRTWTLTRDEYYTLIVKPCHYCELPNNSNSGVGLDRLDNSFGYTADNVVSCCTECNVARSDHFSPEEMIRIGKVIREIKLSRQSNA